MICFKSILKLSLIVSICIGLLACKKNNTSKGPSSIIWDRTEEPAEEKSVEIAKDTVFVSSIEEFVYSLKSNRVIFLEKGKYILKSNIRYEATPDAQRIIDTKKQHTNFRGGQIGLSDFNDLQIIGREGTEIISMNPKASPLSISALNTVSISNLTIRRKLGGESDYISVSNCQNIEFDQLKFEGESNNGLYLYLVDGFQMKNSSIIGCRNNAIRVVESNDLEFSDLVITENRCKHPLVYFFNRVGPSIFKNVRIINNKKEHSVQNKGSDSIFAIERYNEVKLRGCTIGKNNGFQSLGIELDNIFGSKIDGVSIP